MSVKDALADRKKCDWPGCNFKGQFWEVIAHMAEKHLDEWKRDKSRRGRA